jgi:hypothetical protein
MWLDGGGDPIQAMLAGAGVTHLAPGQVRPPARHRNPRIDAWSRQETRDRHDRLVGGPYHRLDDETCTFDEIAPRAHGRGRVG